MSVCAGIGSSDSPVLTAVGGKHRWVSGKRCGIYRVALIYALFNLLKKSHKLQNILETGERWGGNYRSAVLSKQ